MPDTQLESDAVSQFLSQYMAQLPPMAQPPPPQASPLAQALGLNVPPAQTGGDPTLPAGPTATPAPPPATPPVTLSTPNTTPGIKVPLDTSKVPYPVIGQQPEDIAARAADAHATDVAGQKSGISRLWDKEAAIHNPFLRALARVGTGGLFALDAAGSMFAPSAMSVIPGTSLNHAIQVGQSSQAATDADERASKATGNTAAEIAANNASLQPQISEDKIEATAERYQNQLDQKDRAVAAQMQKAGYKVKTDPTTGTVVKDADGNVQYETDTGSLAYQKQQRANDLAESTIKKNNSEIELKEAEAALKKAGNDPNSPAFKLAFDRVLNARQHNSIAESNHDLAVKRYNMAAYGVGADGQPLPGSLVLPDGTPVGTANAANVRPTGTQKDAAGRAVTMSDLSARLEERLKDPDIQEYLGPVGGRLAEAEGRLGTLPQKVADFRNDLVSYGAFQAGMHPVRGIGALDYFDKVMGGMGQTPEELQGKLDSNKATGQSVKNVGTPHVAGGSGPSRTTTTTRVQLRGGTIVYVTPDKLDAVKAAGGKVLP